MALLGTLFYRQVVSRSQLYFFTYFVYLAYTFVLFRLQVQNVEWFMSVDSRNIIILGFVVILYFIDLSSYQHYCICFFEFILLLSLFFNF